MKKIIAVLVGATALWAFSLSSELTPEEIIKKVDENMVSENRVTQSSMTIKGKRKNRVLTSKSWTIGSNQSFTEYLSPAREKGTKMLKLKEELWIYSPASDRTMRISGHMMRQSVMGSDLSYEDMMEDRELLEMYTAKLLGQEEIDGRKVFSLELNAKVDDVAYPKRKSWIDAERFVPLKEELFAKSGKLLKRVTMSNVKEVQGRWYPTKMIYKDMLKDGEGTMMEIISIQFNQEIPDYIFTKAALKK